MSDSVLSQRAVSAYSGTNIPFIEDLYESFLQDPASVPADWRERFAALPPVPGASSEVVSHRALRQDLVRQALSAPVRQAVVNYAAMAQQADVFRLITAYRARGHQNAHFDPLQLHETVPLAELQLAHYGLESHQQTMFDTGSLCAPDQLPLHEIVRTLEAVYTGPVGAEYMYINSPEEKRWLQERLERPLLQPNLSQTEQRWLLHLLSAAEGIEKFMHARFVGQKRFSLEGGESLIPLLDELIQRAAGQGVREVVIGMAHRGRLNVLANILGKAPAAIFEEFAGQRAELDATHILSTGDVKYHKGFSNDIATAEGSIHVTLGFNPSHLEIISPVIMGSVRARQQRYHDQDDSQIIPVIIHGDAAFAGQGVNMETFNMSQARGYAVGGAVHIVVNNQIGFTTSNPKDSRSTFYCTDIAKIVQAPIFHVNGDDPEAVIFVTRLALDYRARFHKDVVIDLVCYRRHGHNEADEPAVTQPAMYRKVRGRPSVRALYAEQLVAAGVLVADEAQAMVNDLRTAFDRGECVGRAVTQPGERRIEVDWHQFRGVSWDQPVTVEIQQDHLVQLAARAFALPDDFPVHARLSRLLSDRHEMAQGNKLVDWGFAENLAYAYLLDQGFAVRLSGQDSRRGTFFHRHAMWRNQADGSSYIPLQHLQPDQPDFTVIDSVLSEEAVLAFEYGYASAEPNCLTIWEAQFGDFANGAQVVIDQFITSAGAKWGLYCGLVLFLPHGYEGQGPEHSSARLERYMQLCAEYNIQVCVPTTPAQIFHLLLRQMLRRYLRPLIVFTPKSLLRHPLATSSLTALSQNRFATVLDEVDPLEKAQIERVVVCTGKVYYDLLEARRNRDMQDVAIIRLEQLYPFPHDDFDAVMAQYPQIKTCFWCQEEPQNQGAWDQIKHRFRSLDDDGIPVRYVGRPSAAAPATGYIQVHQEEQNKLIDQALTGHIDTTMNRRG
jgi:2-oxoglutarate dehydrogenase E1 component